MKIGVFANNFKDPEGRAEKLVYAAAEKINAKAEEYKFGEKYDFVVCVGGDGTILRVAKDCAKTETPILGVNRGTVGFLTEVEPDGLDVAFEKLKKREYAFERRALLDAVIDGAHHYALNEAVIMRSGGGRPIHMEVSVSGEKIDKFACDGYIVCTPTGSTAYSLSAGGSVISPVSPVIALTPINPHTLRTRPLVVGSFENITMTVVGPYSERNAALYVDGEFIRTLEVGQAVSVTGWDRSVWFVRFNKPDFYSKFVHKLDSWSNE